MTEPFRREIEGRVLRIGEGFQSRRVLGGRVAT